MMTNNDNCNNSNIQLIVEIYGLYRFRVCVDSTIGVKDLYQLLEKQIETQYNLQFQILKLNDSKHSDIPVNNKVNDVLKNMDHIYLFVTIPEYKVQQRQQQLREEQQRQQQLQQEQEQLQLQLQLQQQKEQQQQEEQEQCCIEIESSFLPSTPTTLYTTDLGFDMIEQPHQLPTTTVINNNNNITQTKDCMMLDNHHHNMYSYSQPSIISNATPSPPLLDSYSVPFVDTNESYPIVF